MKTTGRRATLWIAVMLALGLCACSQRNEDDMKKQQLELRSKLEQSMSDIDRETDGIKNRLATAADTEKDKLKAQLDRLGEVRDDLDKKLRDMGDTTADNWDEFHRSVERSLDNAKQVLRDVEEHMTTR